MAVEYEIASDVATITGVATNTQLAKIVSVYTGDVTYDTEPTSKFANITINGKTQRVMLCIAVSGTATYDDTPSLYSTVSGHRALNILESTATETPDFVPNIQTTLSINGKNYPATRCVLINKTPVYYGMASVCSFTDDNGKIHAAQLVNIISEQGD